jgi:periplasmic protein TonB
MFEAYELTIDREGSKRLSASLLVASGVLAGLVALTAVLSQRSAEKAQAKAVDVAFRPRPVAKPAEPPNPPPAPKIVRKAMPVAPPTATPVPVAAPAAAPIETPKAVPHVAVKEAPADQAVAAKTMAVGGTGDGTGTAIGGASSAGEADDESPAPVVAKSGPVNLPEEAEPPEPSDDNVMPEYPEAARAASTEAVVVLKIVVEKNGSVGKILVVKGEEPFLAAAIAAVKSWTYEPARVDGTPLSVFKIVKIPFRIRGD